MIWRINNVPGESYTVSGETSPKVYENYTVVQNLDGKTYKVKHYVNDTVSNHWQQKFSKETYETVDQAITGLWKSVPMENAIYGIPRNQFNKLKARHYPDYITHAIDDHTFKGKTCKAGDWCGFASVLTGDYSKGTTLIFEHIHFEIVE